MAPKPALGWRFAHKRRPRRRYEEPVYGPHACGANLDRAVLRDANLSRADLEFASLRNTDLTNASRAGAALGGATLIEVIVAGADFLGADLASTRLIGPIGLDAARNFSKA
jgi:uncharacterized protein YjbI with pentapeptide repeats